MSVVTARAKIVSTSRRLRRDRAGASLLEFGLALPVLLLVAGYGIELANYFIYNLRISQYALDLADNAARVDISDKLREYDINDALTGTYIEGLGIDLTAKGRVILTAIDNVQQDAVNDTEPKARVHWQRCIGKLQVETSLTPKVNWQQGTDYQYVGTEIGATGYGDSDSPVIPPKNGSAMFAEIIYPYEPLFGTLFMGKRSIRYTASFVVRDNRDFAKIENNAPIQPISKCDTYSDLPPKVNHG